MLNLKKLALKLQLILIFTVLFCSEPLRAEETSSSPDESALSSSSDSYLYEKSLKLIATSIEFLGVPYRWGGVTSNAFDCSGFVREVFRRSFNVELPRTALAMSRAGSDIKQNDLRVGDLIFFNTLGRPFSHVGVYLGQGRFIHASSMANQVKIDSLDGYYKKILNGFRRVDVK